MDLLQASVQGEPVTIGNDIFERLSARLVSRPTTAISVTSQITPSISVTSMPPPPVPPVPPVVPLIQKPKSRYDFDRIKRDMVSRGELLQALR